MRPLQRLEEEEGDDGDGLVAEEAGTPENARRGLHREEGKPHHATRGLEELKATREQKEPSAPLPSGGDPPETAAVPDGVGRTRRHKRQCVSGGASPPELAIPARGLFCKFFA